MNVLFLASEAAPYAKSGGLADVAAALPPALQQFGHDVRVIMPRYGQIDPERWGLRTVVEPFRFPAGPETIMAALLRGEQNGVPFYFVEIPWLFGERSTMYSHGDDPRRFVLFCAAALFAMERLGWRPDVIHANDWHTAIAPAMLRGGRAGSFYLDTASVLTIHNLQYQGWVQRYALDGAAAFLPEWARDEWVNLFGLGLGTADLITTVSPTYSQEIRTPEYGESMDGLLRSRADRLHGVLNGLDTEQFNPATDPLIPAHFHADDPSGKAACKAALQREAGLPERADVPVLAMVSRLVDQKGFDLVAAEMEPLLDEGQVQLCILGTGQPRYQILLEELQRRYPENLRAWLGFDAALAQRIYAGADMFLMPSRFEPCGLGQMIAMRYGTVPVVRATGGLADSVHEGPPEEPRTGFVFWEYEGRALLEALHRALAAYRHPEEWRTLVRHGMLRDASWHASAAVYSDLYRQAKSLKQP